MKNIKTYEEFSEGITFEEYLENHNININISNLNCGSSLLLDIIGIDRYKKLDELFIERNELTSLEGIENLTRLKTLSIRLNKIKSLKPIKNLTKLEYLYCYSNKIKNLDGIENLSNLLKLGVNHNPITSLKGIENLTNLIELHLTTAEKINKIDWVDYIDKDGRTYYIKLPKSIKVLYCDKFKNIKEYWEFMDKNQPSGVSRKFNF